MSFSIDPKKGGADAVPTAKITDLISFDDEEDASKATASQNAGPSSGSVLDDFASLTFGDAPSTSTANGSSAAVSGNSGGGLPNDLVFDPSKTSRPVSATSSQLGGWGALQLPMGSGGASNTIKPTTSSSSSSSPSLSTMAQGKRPTAPSSNHGSSGNNGTGNKSTGGNDPFADLSKW